MYKGSNGIWVAEKGGNDIESAVDRIRKGSSTSKSGKASDALIV